MWRENEFLTLAQRRSHEIWHRLREGGRESSGDSCGSLGQVMIGGMHRVRWGEGACLKDFLCYIFSFQLHFIGKISLTVKVTQ